MYPGCKYDLFCSQALVYCKFIPRLPDKLILSQLNLSMEQSIRIPCQAGNLWAFWAENHSKALCLKAPGAASGIEREPCQILCDVDVATLQNLWALASVDISQIHGSGCLPKETKGLKLLGRI